MRNLRDAALRGVRVRLLVDDLYTAGSDPMFRGLAAFPNVEVRLFNPFAAHDRKRLCFPRSPRSHRACAFRTCCSRLSYPNNCCSPPHHALEEIESVECGGSRFGSSLETCARTAFKARAVCLSIAR